MVLVNFYMNYNQVGTKNKSTSTKEDRVGDRINASKCLYQNILKINLLTKRNFAANLAPNNLGLFKQCAFRKF